MKRICNITILLCLIVATMAIMASCDVMGQIPFESFITLPTESTPEEVASDLTTPEGTTPEVTTPEVTTPAGTTPEGTTPEGTTPEGTTPEGTTPEITTPTPHEHVIVIIPAVEPTCTETGLTEGKLCSDCGEILVLQNSVPALGHYQIIESGYKAPTCTETGLSNWVHCAACNTYLQEQTVIPALGHTEVIDEAIEPTCTETGLTEGKHCSVCAAVLVEQTLIPAQHNYVDGNCTVCKLTDTTYFNFTSLEDGTYEISAKDAKNLPANLVIPSEYQGIAITKIANNAFYDSNSFNTTQFLTSVTIPEGITAIGEAAFGFCHNIETITLPSTLVTIEKDAFLKCYLLNNVTIPAAVTSIGDWAFANCEALTNIQISDGVTSIGDYVFYDCVSLASVDLPKSVVEIGYGVFSQCSSLVHVTIPEGETHWNSLFSGCSSLEEIVVPDSVEKFDICTFMGCASLKKVIISPESSLKLISQDAFGECVNLTSIVIPKTVTKIEHNSFNLCTSLTAIYYAGSENDWNNIDFFLQEDNILFSITRYYYSETQPTTSGDFWHYVDGVPTVWEAYVKEGQYIYLGEFPQTIKSDDVTILQITDHRGYFLGSDGCYYAQVKANPCESYYTFSNGETVVENTMYYFKVEPIRWRIITEKGGKVLLLCDMILDCQAYQSNFYILDSYTYYTNANGAPDGTYANNYKYSEIRKWLNETFYKNSFSVFEKSVIIETLVDNSSASTENSMNPYLCEDTQDNVFLLSLAEVTNSEYGFTSGLYSYDEARKITTSDFARAKGALTYMSVDNGIGKWWLRSPDSRYNGSATRVVYFDGFNDSGYVYSEESYGVAPSLWINLDNN